MSLFAQRHLGKDPSHLGFDGEPEFYGHQSNSTTFHQGLMWVVCHLCNFFKRFPKKKLQGKARHQFTLCPGESYLCMSFRCLAGVIKTWLVTTWQIWGPQSSIDTSSGKNCTKTPNDLVREITALTQGGTFFAQILCILMQIHQRKVFEDCWMGTCFPHAHAFKMPNQG